MRGLHAISASCPLLISRTKVDLQGWKLQTARLSGTGKRRAGQVQILDTFLKDRLKCWNDCLSACPGQAKNSAGQVDLFDIFPKQRQIYFVISPLVVVNNC